MTANPAAQLRESHSLRGVLVEGYRARMMNYAVRREPHPYWPYLAARLAEPRSLALNALATEPDGTVAETSQVGLDQLRDDLVPYYGEHQTDWPVKISPCS